MEKGLKRYLYGFNYYSFNRLTCTVKVYEKDGGGIAVKLEKSCDDILHLPFGVRDEDEIGLSELGDFFDSRCFPVTRGDCDKILRSADMNYFNSLEICRRNGGRMVDDKFRVEFINEDGSVEEIGK